MTEHDDRQVLDYGRLAPRRTKRPRVVFFAVLHAFLAATFVGIAVQVGRDELTLGDYIIERWVIVLVLLFAILFAVLSIRYWNSRHIV